MHIRRHDEPANETVGRLRDTHVAVVEHGGGVEQYLEHDHGHDRRTEDRDHRELDEHGQDDFNRMEARAVVTSKSRSAWCMRWSRQNAGTAWNMTCCR